MHALDPVRHSVWQTRSLTCARISLIGALIATSGNPHNEYLLLGSELGLLGPMLLLLLLLGSAWQGWKGRLGSLAENQAVLVVSVTFLAGCMFNSWLFDQNPGHFMALSLGILMAGLNTQHTHR